jgi:hypothetical protein
LVRPECDSSGGEEIAIVYQPDVAEPDSGSDAYLAGGPKRWREGADCLERCCIEHRGVFVLSERFPDNNGKGCAHDYFDVIGVVCSPDCCVE